jgi:hypothetical protein
MQKIHSFIKQLRFAGPLRRSPVGGEAGMTVGSAGTVCSYDQTSGERRP